MTEQKDTLKIQQATKAKTATAKTSSAQTSVKKTTAATKSTTTRKVAAQTPSSQASTPRRIAPSQQRPAAPVSAEEPSSFMQNIIKGLAVLAIGFFGGFIAVQTSDVSQTSLTTEAGERVVLQESQLVAGIAENVGASVVSINVESSQQGFFGGSFSGESAGTGIVLSNDGYIVTNKHVIPENTTEISIVLSDGTTYDDIDVVGRDPFNDIAYLKVNNVTDLTPAVLGSSEEVRVGETVVAIGNALGEFSNTVTTGIISGLSRPIVAGDSTSSDSLQNLFQTDASINPGNSGGPLVNASGEVIGINTAVAGNAENIGFAIPIDDVVSGIETVLAEGELIKPFVGVRYISLNADIAEALDLPVQNGAFLDGDLQGGSSVVEDSPAAKAGLQEGDIIIRADGEEINAESPLGSAIAKFKVGDTLSLVVLRDSQEVNIDVVLERAPDSL